MIQGIQVPAQVIQSTQGHTTVVYPNPPVTPTFTVRQFMGEIKQAVRPTYGQSTMFNSDIYSLRLVFADWPQGIGKTPYPVKAGMGLRLPNDATYQIAGVNPREGSHLEIFIMAEPTG